MIQKIVEGVWKLALDSNVYYLEFCSTLIDTGNRSNHAQLKMWLSKVTELNKIRKVIFTHLHYDHVGNSDLFSNAKFFAGEQEIASMKKDALGTVLREDIYNRIKDIVLHPATDTEDLKVIETPGHTVGSICIWYEKEKILFSGDTIFDKGQGRTDLPTSVPEQMQTTILKLLELNHNILCPGHDY